MEIKDRIFQDFLPNRDFRSINLNSKPYIPTFTQIHGNLKNLNEPSGFYKSTSEKLVRVETMNLSSEVTIQNNF
jgi:hypothetical protein